MISFPCHRLSANPTHQLSSDSVFTHLYISFFMGLPVINTSPGGQYQLVFTIKYSTSNCGFLLSQLLGLTYLDPQEVEDSFVFQRYA